MPKETLRVTFVDKIVRALKIKLSLISILN